MWGVLAIISITSPILTCIAFALLPEEYSSNDEIVTNCNPYYTQLNVIEGEYTLSKKSSESALFTINNNITLATNNMSYLVLTDSVSVISTNATISDTVSAIYYIKGDPSVHYLLTADDFQIYLNHNAITIKTNGNTISFHYNWALGACDYGMGTYTSCSPESKIIVNDLDKVYSGMGEYFVYNGVVSNGIHSAKIHAGLTNASYPGSIQLSDSFPVYAVINGAYYQTSTLYIAPSTAIIKTTPTHEENTILLVGYTLLLISSMCTLIISIKRLKNE